MHFDLLTFSSLLVNVADLWRKLDVPNVVRRLVEEIMSWPPVLE